ncbi:MAG: hypothetical protein PVH73_04000 [Candidatus Bathyarchaeota archaeon]
MLETVYAEQPTSTDDGPITSEESEAPNSESFSLEQVAVILGITATVIAAAALGTGLSVYFKVRRH